MNTTTNTTTPFSIETVIDKDTQLSLLVLKYEDIDNPSHSLEAAIAPSYGSNILRYKVGGFDVFYCDKEAVKEGKWTGCFILWPLPNRYDKDGKKAYEYNGEIVSLEAIQRKEGNKPLIHGLVDDRQWLVIENNITNEYAQVKTSIDITDTSPLYAFFPFKSTLTLTFTLRKEGLNVTYTVNNNDSRPLPSVFALHPYYSLLSGREQTHICVPGLTVMKANSDLLPTGELVSVAGTMYDLTTPQKVAGMMFDDVWTDIADGKDAYVEYTTLGIRITHKVSSDFTHAVLYTQMEEKLGFICLEPQTGSTNAINLHNKAIKEHKEQLKKAAHVIEVPPHTSHYGSVLFEVNFL